MARARAAMLRGSGGMTFSRLMLDRLEYRMGRGADAYHWEGEGWVGGDLNRFAFKTEGEGDFGGPLERAEVQALYSRAIDPRSEERRVGKECVRPCRSRWSPYRKKKKQRKE